MFDEPTEGLDAEGCAHIYTTMNQLAGRGRTIIAFSHDANIVKGTHRVLDLNAKPTPALSSLKTPAAVGGGAHGRLGGHGAREAGGPDDRQ